MYVVLRYDKYELSICLFVFVAGMKHEILFCSSYSEYFQSDTSVL